MIIKMGGEFYNTQRFDCYYFDVLNNVVRLCAYNYADRRVWINDTHLWLSIPVEETICAGRIADLLTDSMEMSIQRGDKLFALEYEFREAYQRTFGRYPEEQNRTSNES